MEILFGGAQVKYGIKFYCDEKIKLPVNYNKILQASLLNWLDDGKYAKYLHDEGVTLNKRRYKFFTFSNIMGNCSYDKRFKSLTFENEIFLVLSFFFDDAHEYILKNIERKKPLKLGNYYCSFINCGMADEKYEDCIVDTVSPITIHSTMMKQDGKKFVYYYEPREAGFNELIAKNISHKLEAIAGIKLSYNLFSIKPHQKTKLKRIVTCYGGLTIKAWKGSFVISGPEEMIKMALLSGIGDRNSIGFGCVLQQNT